MIIKQPLALLIVLLIFVIVQSRYIGREGFNSQLYRAGPTRCFSCEQDLINRYGNTDMAYMGKPTRCFDCERQMVEMGTPNLANLTQPTRCFSCESELL